MLSPPPVGLSPAPSLPATPDQNAHSRASPSSPTEGDSAETKVAGESGPKVPPDETSEDSDEETEDEDWTSTDEEPENDPDKANESNKDNQP